MMQVIKKWRIIIYFELSNKDITFIIYDNFYGNMLSKLSEISFDLEPSKIEIYEFKEEILHQAEQNTFKDCIMEGSKNAI